MDDSELIAETNRLLRTLLQNDAEQRTQAKEKMKEIREKMGELKETVDKSPAEPPLEAQGVPSEVAQGSEKEWDARREVAVSRSKENLEESRLRHERYQDDLLAELRTQSDLLRQIAERLAR